MPNLLVNLVKFIINALDEHGDEAFVIYETVKHLIEGDPEAAKDVAVRELVERYEAHVLSKL
jgi:hypothetical protein